MSLRAYAASARGRAMVGYALYRGVKLHPFISVGESKERGRHLVATDNIHEGEVLVHVPYEAWEPTSLEAGMKALTPSERDALAEDQQQAQGSGLEWAISVAAAVRGLGRVLQRPEHAPYQFILPAAAHFPEVWSAKEMHHIRDVAMARTWGGARSLQLCQSADDVFYQRRIYARILGADKNLFKGGLIPIIDFANHSFSHNAAESLDDGTLDRSLSAVRHIECGDEITIDYVDCRLPATSMGLGFGFLTLDYPLDLVQIAPAHILKDEHRPLIIDPAWHPARRQAYLQTISGFFGPEFTMRDCDAPILQFRRAAAIASLSEEEAARGDLSNDAFLDERADTPAAQYQFYKFMELSLTQRIAVLLLNTAVPKPPPLGSESKSLAALQLNALIPDGGLDLRGGDAPARRDAGDSAVCPERIHMGRVAWMLELRATAAALDASRIARRATGIELSPRDRAMVEHYYAVAANRGMRNMAVGGKLPGQGVEEPMFMPLLWHPVHYRVPAWMKGVVVSQPT